MRNSAVWGLTTILELPAINGHDVQGAADQVDEAFRTPADLIREIAAAGCSDNSLDETSFAIIDTPEPHPALLANVSQTTAFPTVAHLGTDRGHCDAIFGACTHAAACT